MKNKKLYIIFCILIVIFSSSLAEKTLQNDTLAIIALGRDEIANRLDGYDHLTFHEGLKSAHSAIIFDIILYKTYEIFDFLGIYILIIILTIINGLLLFNFLLIKNKSKTISFFISMFILYFSYFIFVARPTILVMPFMLIIVICIEKILETNKNKYCILLLISSVLLINIHDVMWLVHFIFYLPFFAEQILAIIKLDKYINRKVIIKKYDNIKKLIIVFIFDLLCGLITPLPGSIILLIKEVIYTVTGNLEISELSSVDIRSSISLIIIIVFMLFQFMSKHKNRISDIFMLLGLIILAVMGARYGVFLYFIGSLSINKMIYEMIKEYDRVELIEDIDKNILKFTNIFIISLTVIIISIKNFTGKIGDKYISEAMFPIDICEYIVENLDIEDIRVYNHFNYGAYLEFMHIPNFIDGRSGIYYQKYGNTSIVDDFLKVDESGYDDVFEKYNITHIILYNQEEANEKIYEDEKYELLYQTDMFSLYEKK